MVCVLIMMIVGVSVVGYDVVCGFGYGDGFVLIVYSFLNIFVIIFVFLF